MKSDTASLLKQFDHIEQAYQEMNGKTKYKDEFSDLPVHVSMAFQTACLSCIDRIAGRDSTYSRQAQATLAAYNQYISANAAEYYGITQALKADIAAGYMSTLRELIHADVFSDLLENADYFLSEGHKDPAAVIAGGVLEEHLRQLCRKNGIAVEAPNAAGVIKPRMGDSLNSSLHKANVYSLMDQKQVVAWLDLRNKSAHGRYTEYIDADVNLLIQGRRIFIGKYPA